MRSKSILHIYYYVAFIITALLISSCSASKYTAGLADIDSTEKKEVIIKICSIIKTDYVIPETGEKCINKITGKLAEGGYDAIVQPEEFAKEVVKDLVDISNDKHFSIDVLTGEIPVLRRNTTPEEVFMGKISENHFLQRGNFGFMGVKWYSGNIGYLDMRAFTSVDIAADKAAAVMKFLADMDAVIIDFRSAVRGGSPEMVAMLCSYFLEKPTLYNTLYFRRGNRTDEEWTLAKVKGKRLTDVPLYILTNSNVFSACEAFTYSMQALKRGIVVGEPTKGGAHLSRTVPVNKRFNFTIPFGRAVNPITKSNWEGTGVIPDVRVNSDDALETALKMAKIPAEEHRTKREASDLENGKALFNKFITLVSKTTPQNSTDDVKKLKEILNEGFDLNLLTEEMINQIGYDLLGKKMLDLAIAAFQFNTEKFPYSFNAFDSLGEAFMAKGDTTLSIINYQKSLEINPHNAGAIRIIEKNKQLEKK